MTREPTGPGCARRSGPGPSVTLSASASDAKGAARVDFYVGSQMVGTDSTAGGTSGQEHSASLKSTTLPDGPATVMARAYDAAGNEKVSARSFHDQARREAQPRSQRRNLRNTLRAHSQHLGQALHGPLGAIRGDQSVEAERRKVQDQDGLRAVQGRGGRRLGGGLRQDQVPQISGR